MRYTIEDAAKFLEVTPHYVRTLIRNNILRSQKYPIKPGSLTSRHEIEEEELIAYSNLPKTRSRRDDGRHRFVAFLMPKEYEVLTALLIKEGYPEIAANIMPQNTIKALGFKYAPDEHGSGRFIDKHSTSKS